MLVRLRQFRVILFCIFLLGFSSISQSARFNWDEMNDTGGSTDWGALLLGGIFLGVIWLICLACSNFVESGENKWYSRNLYFPELIDSEYLLPIILFSPFILVIPSMFFEGGYNWPLYPSLIAVMVWVLRSLFFMLVNITFSNKQ